MFADLHLQIYCRLNVVITDKPNFPALYIELPQAAVASPLPALWSRLPVSSARLLPCKVRFSVSTGRAAPSAWCGDAPSVGSLPPNFSWPEIKHLA